MDADAIYLCYGHAETFQGPVLELKSKTHNLVSWIIKYIASDSDGLYLLFQAAREDKSICTMCLILLVHGQLVTTLNIKFATIKHHQDASGFPA